jgi:YidC/Oxa1 family membrane protein insertase
MDFLGTILWPIKWVIEAILVGFHWLFDNIGLDGDQGITWILSIVCLTFVVRSALIPLFVRQIKSQRKMMMLAPDMKKIQDKYKGKKDQFSREAMSRETMGLYKKHGTSPFSSCLPLLIQMPIFISLFFVLSTAANFANTIANLDPSIQPGDPTYPKPGIDGGLVDAQLALSFSNATIFGAPLHSSIQSANGNVAVWIIAIFMIVLMTASQFFTQLQIMSKNQSPEMKASPMYRQQRVLLYILPFVFVFSSWAFPIGVMFYWVASNGWTLVQQYIVIRNMPTPGSEAALEREARMLKKQQRRGIEVVEFTDETPDTSKNEPTQRSQPVNHRRKKKGGGRR